MLITAVVARIENGHAVLLSDEIGVEISIPVEMIDGSYNKGEKITLTIDNLFDNNSLHEEEVNDEI